MFVSFAWAAPQYAVVAINQTLTRGPSGPGVGFVVKPVPVKVIGPEEGGWRVRTVADTSHCYPPMISGLSLDLWVPEGAFATVLSAPVQRSSEGGTVTFAAGHIVGAPGDDGWAAIEGRSLRARVALPANAVGDRYGAEALPVGRGWPGTYLRHEALLRGEGFEVTSVGGEQLVLLSDGSSTRVEEGCIAVKVPGDLTPLGVSAKQPKMEGGVVSGVELPEGTELRWPQGGVAGHFTRPFTPDIRPNARGCWDVETGLSELDGDALTLCVDLAVLSPPGPRSVHASEVQMKRRVAPVDPKPKHAPPEVNCQVAIAIDATGRPVSVDALSCEEPYLTAVEQAVMASVWYPYKGEVGFEPVRIVMLYRFKSG